MTSEAGETVSVKLAVCVRAGLLESVTLKVRGVLVTDCGRRAGDGAGRSIQGQASRKSAAGQRPSVRRDAAGSRESGTVSDSCLSVRQRRGRDDQRRGEIVRVKAAVCVRAGVLESVTIKVSGVLATAAEGVPVMAPVEAFRAKPAGRVAAGQRPGVRRDAAGRGEGGAISSTELTGGQRRSGDLDLRRRVRVGGARTVSATLDERSYAQGQE